MNFQIECEGADEVAKLLQQDIPALVVSRGLFVAGTAASEEIQDALEQTIPERSMADRGDDPDPLLKDSIKVEVTMDSRHRGISVDIGFGKMGHVARFVEYGHRMVGHKPDKKMMGMVGPKPFIRPALKASSEPAMDKFTEILREELQKTGVME